MASYGPTSGKWPDPLNEKFVYVHNPIEADLPSHWVPMSVLKKVLEIRASNASTRPFRSRTRFIFGTGHTRIKLSWTASTPRHNNNKYDSNSNIPSGKEQNMNHNNDKQSSYKDKLLTESELIKAITKAPKPLGQVNVANTGAAKPKSTNEDTNAKAAATVKSNVALPETITKKATEAKTGAAAEVKTEAKTGGKTAATPEANTEASTAATIKTTAEATTEAVTEPATTPTTQATTETTTTEPTTVMTTEKTTVLTTAKPTTTTKESTGNPFY